MIDRLRILVLGIATRRALSDYLLGTGLILFILASIAYTIDLARWFPQIRTAAAERDVSLLSLLLPYLGQRGVDIVTRMLPVAAFFGPFIAEIARRLRLETVILATAGVSPLYTRAALMWLALLLGLLNWGLEASWRPAAVWAQVDSGFGGYAARFRRDWVEGKWFVRGDIAIRGDVLRTDTPEMRDVLIFEGVGGGALRSIRGAERIVSVDGRYRWRMEGVTEWRSEPEAGGDRPREVELPLVPEQLTYYGVLPYMLPTPALNAVSDLRARAPEAPAYATALWRRWTAVFLPGAIAYLAIALANLGFEGRRALIPRLIALGTLGYASVVTVKVFRSLGQFDILPPALSVPGSLLLLAVAAAFVARRAP
ncbi:LptF/LptG family permease [Psychromarinibacter sp. C21-152]|uniref:LptF/LptG family permease n=1 Tax=Psychromarinibacter sediminicola TaxID=3033385 RepID=A0AAE3NQ88_9RHOB|nr:LptF/LptG family permease [Psychromarinibacter sediminicola]MDF0600031.1 LptF/LptG family permease [Psychromarinibacter sediminicola]